MADANPREVMLKKVQISFCDSLKEAKSSIANGPKKHGSNFIIDGKTPEGKKNLAKMNAAVAAAEQDEFGKTGVVEKLKDPKRRAFRPGDEFVNADDEIYTGYEGEDVWGISAKGPGKVGSPKRPLLLNRKKEQVAIEDIDDVFVPGQYVDAKVYVYCTSKEEQGGRGLFVTVNAIRAHQEGPIFGGGRASASEFDDMEDAEDTDEDDLLG